MDRPNKSATPWVFDFILLAAVWGASFMFMRLAVVEFGSVATATLRAGIGALALLPLLFWRRKTAHALRCWKPLFVAGVLNAGLPTGCISFALLSISSGLASIMNATVPLFGAVLAFIWFGHKPTRLAAAGLVIGFGGVAMLAWGNVGLKPGAQSWTAAIAMLVASIGALSGALSALYTRRYLADAPPLVIAAGSQVGASLGLAAPAIAYWPAHPPGLQAWLAVAAAGVLCTGLGYLLFFRVLERAGPTRALTVTFLMPLFAMLYGIAFLHESVTLAMLGCAVLIIGGTALSMGFGTRWLAGRARRAVDSSV